MMQGDMIFEYFSQTRGVGHTKALLTGLPNNSLVLVGTDKERRPIERQALDFGSVIRAISLTRFESQMRSLRLPLVIDNHAFIQLWVDARQGMRLLDKEIKRLNATIKEQADWIDILSGKKQP